MKFILFILFALAGMFLIACRIETAPPMAPPILRMPLNSNTTDNQWRRTADGWERKTSWQSTRTTMHAIPKIDFGIVHPALIAALQLLVSVGALAFFRGHSKLPSNRAG